MVRQISGPFAWQMQHRGLTLVRMAMSDAERQRRLRERRAKLIQPAEHPLRAVEDMLEPALQETLQSLELGPEHAAAVQLALRYARCIDRAEDVAWACRWLAPLYLDALTALGATPMSRPKQQKAPAGTSRLDELRMRRVSVPGHGPGS